MSILGHQCVFAQAIVLVVKWSLHGCTIISTTKKTEAQDTVLFGPFG